MVTPLLGDYGLGFGVDARRGGPYFEHGGSDAGFRAQLVAHRDKGWGASRAKCPGFRRHFPKGSSQSQAITRTIFTAVAVRRC
jgi:hypothetical protein